MACKLDAASEEKMLEWKQDGWLLFTRVRSLKTCERRTNSVKLQR